MILLSVFTIVVIVAAMATPGWVVYSIIMSGDNSGGYMMEGETITVNIGLNPYYVAAEECVKSYNEDGQQTSVCASKTMDYTEINTRK